MKPAAGKLRLIQDFKEFKRNREMGGGWGVKEELKKVF